MCEALHSNAIQVVRVCALWRSSQTRGDTGMLFAIEDPYGCSQPIAHHTFVPLHLDVCAYAPYHILWSLQKQYAFSLSRFAEAEKKR